MNENQNIITDIEEYMSEEFGNYFDKMGSKRLFGRIFGLLLVQLSPISLKDCAVKLRVSKPAVSTTMNIGVQMDLIQKTHNPEFPRESFYSMNIEFMEMIIDPGIAKLNQLNNKILKGLDIINNSKTEQSIETNLVKDRIKFIYDGFNITIDEYKFFGDRVKNRIKEIRGDGHF